MAFIYNHSIDFAHIIIVFNAIMSPVS